MDLLEIKLECDQTTLFKNLKDKSGKIDCPACQDHKMDVEQCLSMLFNQELVLKQKIELSLKENLQNELLTKLDDQYNCIVNQIDIQCETLIKQINDYRLGLVDQLQEKKTYLKEKIESIEPIGFSKESLNNELAKETTLSNKIKIEKQYEVKLNERKQSLLDELKMMDYVFKIAETSIEQLVGTLELRENANNEKKEIKKDNNMTNKDNHLIDIFNQATIISIQSKANYRFVCAELFGTSPLNPSRSWIGGWEKFILIRNSDNTVSFKSKFNKKYVSACDKGNGPLVARTYEVGDEEKFILENNQDGSYSFKALINNKFVMPNDGQSGFLIAKGDLISDQQKFLVQILYK